MNNSSYRYLKIIFSIFSLHYCKHDGIGTKVRNGTYVLNFRIDRKYFEVIIEINSGINISCNGHYNFSDIFKATFIFSE